jgi:hypothetical protein
MIADFEIRNHGKAPAFLTLIQIVLFLSFESPADAPFGGDFESEIEIPRFPEVGDLDEFIAARGRAPMRNMNAVSEEPPADAIAIRRAFDAVRFDRPITLPSGEPTERYFASINPLHGGDPQISIESLAHVFLIGRVTFDGPTIENETLTFCFRANRFGGFESFGRAPYNERKRASAEQRNDNHGAPAP